MDWYIWWIFFDIEKYYFLFVLGQMIMLMYICVCVCVCICHQIDNISAHQLNALG